MVLAQQEARMLGHNYIGTEHILVGLIHEGEGVAATALKSLGVGLEMVRQQVGQIAGPGKSELSRHMPFTPRAKKALELSLHEAQQLGHTYIGTEHILLGLIHEGTGVAAQVLVKLGAGLDRVRQEVIRLLRGYQGNQLAFSGGASGESWRGEVHSDVPAGVSALESRLSAIEQRVGTGPATDDLDKKIAQVRRRTESAIYSQDFEEAVSLRGHEGQLLADKTARRQQWKAAHPDLASLAEQVQRLTGELDRLRDLLCQHGIEPEDKSA